MGTKSYKHQKRNRMIPLGNHSCFGDFPPDLAPEAWSTVSSYQKRRLECRNLPAHQVFSNRRQCTSRSQLLGEDRVGCQQGQVKLERWINVSSKNLSSGAFTTVEICQYKSFMVRSVGKLRGRS